MVVRVRAGAGLVVDHEHRVELRVEALVDEHLHGDPAVREDGGRHASRHRRGADRLRVLQHLEVHLAVPEQEEVVVARVAGVERSRGAVGRRPEPERVAPVRPRPGRGHLDPPRRARRAKRVRHPDGDRPACAGLERHAAPLEVEHGVALEDVEARLERVQVLVDVPVGELYERQRHVRRAERAVDEAAAREPARAPRKRVAEDGVLAADEPIARPAVGEVVRPGVAAHSVTPDGSTTADEATAAANPGPLSLRPSAPSATRSAPRT
jgi:hypothetical protein